MYENIYAPLPDPGAYLARIGLNPEDYDRRRHPELPASPSEYSMPHTKESLDKLVYGNLFNIPFETLDVYDLRREVSLEIPDLFEKIVARKRGGYCFELNGLFYALLQSLGFDCYPIAVRILFEGDFPAVGHRSTIVTLPDGKRCVCDVGFGGPTPVGALYLDETEWQTSGQLTFRYEKLENGLFRFVRLCDDGSIQALQKFSDQPYELIDFIPLNVYMSRGDTARFNNERVLNLMRPQGSAAMINDTLRLHDNEVITEIELRTPEERKEAYIKVFNIPAESLTEF